MQFRHWQHVLLATSQSLAEKHRGYYWSFLISIPIAVTWRIHIHDKKSKLEFPLHRVHLKFKPNKAVDIVRLLILSGFVVRTGTCQNSSTKNYTANLKVGLFDLVSCQ